MAAFEYRYRFSVDEEIIQRYNCRLPVDFAIEIRTNFVVKGTSSDDDQRIIDSERYAVERCREEHAREDMIARLKHYWMADHEIDRLINEAVLFAKTTAASAGRGGKIPTAVDLNIYTLQQEGEAIEATVDRAMRAEYLPPLYLSPVKDCANPNPRQRGDYKLVDFLKEDLEAVRVNDVAEGLSVMEACGVCRRKPMVGTEISSLRCGHVFHKHCIVRRLEDDKCCPICRRPAYPRANIRQEKYIVESDIELEDDYERGLGMHDSDSDDPDDFL